MMAYYASRAPYLDPLPPDDADRERYAQARAEFDEEMMHEIREGDWRELERVRALAIEMEGYENENDDA